MSANVYVGFHDQRNSSRVLKPPGGGTSIIFGNNNDLIPDVVPQISPRRDEKYRGSSIQDVLCNTEIKTTTHAVTKNEEKSNVKNGSLITTIKSSSSSSSTSLNNGNVELKNDADNQNLPDVAAEITCKVDQIKIEEKSSTNIATETDSSGNTKILANDSNCERSFEQNSSFNKGSSIGEILSQEDILETKKITNNNNNKGHSPNQRVPPGGYSSGLW